MTFVLRRIPPLLTIALLASFAPSSAAGGIARALVEPWRFRPVPTAHGLGAPDVVGLCVRAGQTYVATPTGLCIYDGATVDRCPREWGLPSGSVVALDLDARGRGLVLLQTDHGVEVFQRWEGRFRRVALPGLRPLGVGAALLPGGRGLFLVEADGVPRLCEVTADGRKVRLRGEDIGSLEEVRFLRRLASGRVFLHLVGRLLDLSEEGRAADAAARFPPTGVLGFLDENAEGDGLAVVVYPPSRCGVFTWRRFGSVRRVSRLGRLRVRAAAVAPGGAVLLVAAGGRVFVYDGEKGWSEVSGAAHSLRAARALTFLPGGDLLVGGDDGLVLTRLSGEPLSRVALPGEGGTARTVNEIRVTDDEVLLSTERGVLVGDGEGAWRELPPLDDVNPAAATSAVRDAGGRIWMTSGGGFEGIHGFWGGSWHRVARTVGGRPIGLVHRIRACPGDRGRGAALYLLGLARSLERPFETAGSIFRVSGEQAEVWPPARSLPKARIYDLVATGVGGFVGASTGLYHVGGGKAVALSRRRTRSLLRLPSGRVAAGVQSEVWILAPDGRLERRVSLGDGEVMALTGDGGDGCFALTRRHIHRVDVEGPARPVFVLPDLIRPVTCMAHDATRGRLWLGSAGSGLFALDLDRLSRVEAELGSLSLTSDGTRLRVVAASFHGLLPPADLRVRFRLDGGEWSPWIAPGEVELGESAPGAHKAEVELLHSFRGRPTARRTISFVVPAPWWKRPVPRAVLLSLTAAVLAGLFAAWRARARSKALLRAREAELERSHRLEALGRLAAGIAHDFNNVMTALLGNTDLLEEELLRPHPDPRRARADLDRVRAAAGRAVDLTERLVAIGRPRETRAAVVDVRERVENVTGLLERLLDERIRLDVEVPRRPALVFADPSHIDRVLLNLALNGGDAMRGRGGRLAVEVRSRDGSVDVSVEDEGPGVPEALRRRIFEPFFTTKRGGLERAGVGLGLATVKTLVERMGGTIRVDSGSAAGARFTVSLPRVADGDAEPRMPLSATAAGRNETESGPRESTDTDGNHERRGA